MKGLKVSQTRQAGISPCLSSLHGLGNSSKKHCQSVLFLQMIICFYVFLTWAVISGQSCLTKQISFAMCSPFSAVKNYKGIKDMKSHWTMQKRKPADTLLNYFYCF